MTKLVNVDLLGNSLNTETKIQHPNGRPVMLAFVNITGNPSILSEGDGGGFKTALTFLSNNLDDRGTVVVALAGFDFPATILTGWFRATDGSSSGERRAMYSYL